MNKYLLSSTGFNYPVFVTLCHQTACLVLGALVHYSGWIPAKPIKSRGQFSKVVVLAVIFCLTIVLGNASLQWLAVSEPGRPAALQLPAIALSPKPCANCLPWLHASPIISYHARMHLRCWSYVLVLVLACRRSGDVGWRDQVSFNQMIGGCPQHADAAALQPCGKCRAAQHACCMQCLQCIRGLPCAPVSRCCNWACCRLNHAVLHSHSGVHATRCVVWASRGLHHTASSQGFHTAAMGSMCSTCSIALRPLSVVQQPPRTICRMMSGAMASLNGRSPLRHHPTHSRLTCIEAHMLSPLDSQCPCVGHR